MSLAESTAEIDRILQDAVDSGAVPNIAAVVAGRDGILYEGAAGPRVVGQDEPVTPDSHYWIMSMTTKVATVAALQLAERGQLDLRAPIQEYCPAFADLQVLDGFDGTTPRLRPPASQARVEQLITHTAGLGYWFFSDDLVRFLDTRPSESGVITEEPLLCDPGTAFTYGLNTDWLSRVLESASGQTLDVVVKESVTGPLGMDRTSYSVSDENRSDQVPVHLRREDGSWTASEIVMQMEPEYFSGGHGLNSTPLDYLRFQRALLGDGEVEGTRILQPSTVANAFTNQIGDLGFPASIPSADHSVSCDVDLGPGFTWGHGLLLNHEDIPGRRRAGSGSWAGLLNTQFWVDRKAGVTGGLYTQFLPYSTPESVKVFSDIERAVYAAL